MIHSQAENFLGCWLLAWLWLIGRPWLSLFSWSLFPGAQPLKQPLHDLISPGTAEPHCNLISCLSSCYFWLHMGSHLWDGLKMSEQSWESRKGVSYSCNQSAELANSKWWGHFDTLLKTLNFNPAKNWIYFPNILGTKRIALGLNHKCVNVLWYCLPTIIYSIYLILLSVFEIKLNFILYEWQLFIYYKHTVKEHKSVQWME